MVRFFLEVDMFLPKNIKYVPSITSFFIKMGLMSSVGGLAGVPQ